MTKKRYSHAYTIAFEVDSDGAEGATLDEWLAALERRVANLRRNRAEANEAWGTDTPYDTSDRDPDQE